MIRYINKQNLPLWIGTILSGVAISIFWKDLVLSRANHYILFCIALGVFSSFVTILILDLSRKYSNYIQFNPIKGNWEGYNLNGRDLGNQISSVTIKYLQTNILEVSLTHPPLPLTPNSRTWIGRLQMNEHDEKSGIITLKYNDVHEVGQRKVLMFSDEMFDYIYIIPLDNTIYKFDCANGSVINSYGIEVMKRTRKR